MQDFSSINGIFLVTGNVMVFMAGCFNPRSSCQKYRKIMAAIRPRGNRVRVMWKLWQVIILMISLAMWIGWSVWSHLNKEKHDKDDSYEIEVIFMINAINFILILIVLD